MTNKSVFLSVAAILVAGAGLATVVLGSGDNDTTDKAVAVAQANEGGATIPPAPGQAQQAFETMAVDSDHPECRVPRPPRDLARSAYIRNGYAAIRQIMAMQRWQETGSCDCFAEQITWPEAIAESENYVTSDNPLLPFDVVALQKKGDELAARRLEACGG